MGREPRALPDLKDLFRAADAHAAEAGDADHAVGDLQMMLRAAWRAMSVDQRGRFLAQPEMTELAGLPKYEPLLGGRAEEVPS